MLTNAAKLLVEGGPLVLHKPYFQRGVETAPSTPALDRDLNVRDPRHDLHPTTLHPMPANNLTVAFAKG